MIYITNALLEKRNLDIKNKKIIISGAGKVGLYAALKATELGAKVVAMNDFSGGTVVDESGLNIEAMIDIKQNQGGFTLCNSK